MPEFNELCEKAANLMDYVTGCIDLPMYAASCRPLWNVVMYASVAFGLLVIAWVFWLAATKPHGTAASTSTAARRTSGDSRKRNVRDDGVDLSDVTDLHLAIKIREELERQRIRNITGR
jgi:hypothetical protein